MSQYIIIPDEDFLMHHGIKGQRWGVRRFQNADGSLTTAGAKRYGTEHQSSLDDVLNNYKNNKKYRPKDVKKIASAALKDTIKQQNELTKKSEEIVKKYGKKGDKYGTPEYDKRSKELEAIDNEWQKIGDRLYKSLEAAGFSDITRGGGGRDKDSYLTLHLTDNKTGTNYYMYMKENGTKTKFNKE